MSSVDEISIPVSLLEQMHDTVTSAYYYSQTIDLQEVYRNMRKTPPKLSKMTEGLGAAEEILQTFITLAKETEDEQNSDTD